MAHYVVLANFTEQGIRAVKDTAKRAKAVRELAKEKKITIKDIFWTMGAYDVILTMQAPDDETVASFMLQVGSAGNLKSQTLRAFSEADIGSLVAGL